MGQLGLVVSAGSIELCLGQAGGGAEVGAAEEGVAEVGVEELDVDQAIELAAEILTYAAVVRRRRRPAERSATRPGTPVRSSGEG